MALKKGGTVMFHRRDAQVLVVGAGPVGMVAAIALARRQLKVVIIDQQWRAAAQSCGIILQPPALRLFEALGVGEEIARHARFIDVVAVHDAQGRRRAIFAMKDRARPPQHIAIIAQSTLEHILEQELREQQLSVWWSHRLEALSDCRTHMHAQVGRWDRLPVGYGAAHAEWELQKTLDLEADFVIGADGHRSMVRRQLGLRFAPYQPAENFALFDVTTSTPVDDQMVVMLDQATASVCCPMPGGQCRWAFELGESGQVHEPRGKSRLRLQMGNQFMPHRSRAMLMRMMAQRGSWFNGIVDRVNWALAMRFEQRLAERLGSGRAWLAGDAAHLSEPIAGHSMNTGIQEAADLADRIAGVIQRNEPVETLAAYDHHWRAVWRRLIDRSRWVWPGGEPWLQTHGGRIAARLPVADDELGDLLLQVNESGAFDKSRV